MNSTKTIEPDTPFRQAREGEHCHYLSECHRVTVSVYIVVDIMVTIAVSMRESASNGIAPPPGSAQNLLPGTGRQYGFMITAEGERAHVRGKLWCDDENEDWNIADTSAWFAKQNSPHDDWPGCVPHPPLGPALGLSRD